MKFTRLGNDNNEILYTIDLDNEILRKVAPLFSEADHMLNELIGPHNSVTQATLQVKKTRDDEQTPYEAATVTYTKNGAIATSIAGDNPTVVMTEVIDALEDGLN